MKSSPARVLPHVIFWVISYIILYNIFSADYKLGASDVYYTLLFHLPLFVVAYGNLLLCGRYLNDNRVFIYLLTALLLLIPGILLYYLIFNILADIILPGYFFIAYYSPFEIGIFLTAYILLTTLLFFTWQGIRLREIHIRKISDQKSSQLEHLRKSINPHFLFNSLNNIYGSMGSEHSPAKKYLKKLSDTLRYMLYESDEPLIPLTNEIKYLEDYISLEKIRFDKAEEINFEKKGRFDGYLIPPLLLLPQVENCFKHCDGENPEIKILVKQEVNKLTLETRNKIHSGAEKEGGIGIQNLMTRLQLLYDNNFALSQKKEGDYYHTFLSVNLDP